MDKHVTVSSGTDPRLVEKTRAVLTKTLYGLCQIVNLNGEMMQPRSAFRDEARNGGLIVSRFEQFNAGIARRQHGYIDMLYFDCLLMCDWQAEHVAVERQLMVEAADGNTQMIYFKRHFYEVRTILISMP